MSLSSSYSLHDWAINLAQIIGKTVSKTAIWKRIKPSLVDSLKELLCRLFESGIKDKLNDIIQSPLLPFNRVFLQDSTNIKLADVLSGFYKGNMSKGIQKSLMKIQVVYELLSGTFESFKIGNFTDNDQGAARDIIKILKPGDLVIRDLGYFVLKAFSEIASAGAFYLTRYKFGCHIYCQTTANKLKLLNILKGNYVDIQILLGAKEKLPCRLVAIRLPENVAAERRRKAKEDRDKRINHSKEYMELLGWAIFITNVPQTIWTWDIIPKVYKIRWHIEIIFKGWKSHFKIDKFLPSLPLKSELNENDILRYKISVEMLIYLGLVTIILVHNNFYFYFAQKAYKEKEIMISYIKVCKFIKNFKEAVFSSPDWSLFEEIIFYYSVYEKRRKRLNHIELIFNLTCNS
jgi:hypothetical protein